MKEKIGNIVDWIDKKDKRISNILIITGIVIIWSGVLIYDPFIFTFGIYLICVGFFKGLFSAIENIIKYLEKHRDMKEDENV